MTRFRNAVVALMASLCTIALLPATQASAASAPRTWHVLVGGHAEGQAIQAEGYYPHVITIDAGDTVTWTLKTKEIHSVTFTGTCGDISCIPPCYFAVNIDASPCGATTYDGISLLASSGRMVPAGYNWDNAVPRGGTTYSLTFLNPGVNVYFDLSISGMRGVVVVNPAGTPYPFTQAQYSDQARDQLRSDLEAGARAREDFQPIATTTNPNGTRVHHVALGTSVPESARVELESARGGSVEGRALLQGSGVGSSQTPTIAVKISLSGLKPGSVHAAQILLGLCGAPASTKGLLLNVLFNPATFTLNPLTAGPDGRAVGTTVISQPINFNGPGQLRIPTAGWFINVAAGSTADNGATSAACGNVVFHNAAVVRYLPQTIRAQVGDTIAWANETINEIHGVTFLAGQALPLVPDWYLTGPSGNPASYDGSSYLNSAALYAADAGRNHSLTVTFTKPGTFPYIDVATGFLGMHGTVVVVPREVGD